MLAMKRTVYCQITESRWLLFGISCLWIFFRHTFFYNQYEYGFFDPIVQIGDCGVDIFLFLSGYGLYFSYTKDHDIKIFYKKRFWRIIPPVIILLLAFSLIEILCGNAISKYLSPLHWIWQIYCIYWYVGAIILFYLAFPFIYKVAKENAALSLLFSFIIAFGGIFIVKASDVNTLGQLIIYFARVPIFVLGCVLAYKSEWLEKRGLFRLILLFGIPLLYIIPKDIQRLCYSFTTIGIILILSYIQYFTPKKLSHLICVIGKSSLEFYLIHIFLLSHNMLDLINHYVNFTILTSIIGLIISCIMSIIAHKVIEYFVGRIRNRLSTPSDPSQLTNFT